MAEYRTLDDVDVGGKRVLVRLDLNVPLDGGKITDFTRIERAAPTLTELAGASARIIVLSHFGRPKGEVVPNMSLDIVCRALAAVTGTKVTFVPTDWRNMTGAHEILETLAPGSIAVMENTRFHPGETENDPDFAALIAGLGDLYVNDAFSAAHRAHASTEGVARLLPAFAGRAMQHELEALTGALEKPARPLVAVVGGAKISTKLDVLGALSARVNSLIIGGGMANTFLAAQGKPVGKSLCEHDLLDTARDIVETAAGNGCTIVLPRDVVVAELFEAHAPHRTVSVDAVGPEEMIVDVGPQSLGDIERIFSAARTLVWNGPFGAFEMPPFDAGTNTAARTVGRLCRKSGLRAVAGGGDTVAALNHAGVADDFTYVSTAGGAFLEWLEGKTLPGVSVLEKA